ncbi:acyl-CoA dehydrogenase [Variovorax sp. HJSM1_2]|uniref:acyl-CoA dehydrogenase n=1 Tax=Variovorax sp. HJSM1_2 TaxID=3366263 RepID=UPI003BC990D9
MNTRAMEPNATSPAHVLAERLRLGKPAEMQWLDMLIAEGLDQLPLPGASATLERWRALAAVGAFDLSLAKLYEGHTDALAILAELAPTTSWHEPSADGPRKAQDSWAVWAAEAPGGRTTFVSQADGTVLLHGSKFWCSGALTAKHALLTAWDQEGTGPQLIRVNLRAPGITVDASKWRAVGMAHSASVNVRFANTRAQLVGAPGDYLQRPGFWHGGAGIAACWFGGALGLARALRSAVTRDAAHATAATATAAAPLLRSIALGQVDLALRSTAAVLREAAAWIDHDNLADAREVALRARLSAEQCAKTVLDAAGRALGATPFCLDEKFAQAAADLPVFIRQSHAERDLAALGERVAAVPEAWAL